MLVFRLTRIILHLLSGLFSCALIFPITDDAGRTRRIKRWSMQLLSICRVQVELSQRGSEQAGLHAMIVANHISWLDIFVIDSIFPSRFVAKSNIRDWPLIGWLCAMAGTIFIARGRMRDVRRIFQGLVVSIQNGEHVAFFPEGTTAAQGALLPFHANLFEAAIDAKVPVQPYALRYVNASGAFHPTVDFVGDMSFAESMLAILRGEKIIAHLIVLPLIETTGTHRRDLAQSAQDAIAEALGHRTEPSNLERAQAAVIA
jgi:1-acyl-sn-glycerol-3-phosphate acyltransferase